MNPTGDKIPGDPGGIPTPARPPLHAWLVAVLVILTGAGSGCAGRKTGPPTLEPPEVLIRDAREKMAEGKYLKARDILNNITHNPAASQVELSEAQLLLADAYFFDKGFLNLTEAQGRYQNFVTFNPRHEKVAYAQYQLAMCYFLQVLEPDRDQDQTRRAIEEFRKVELVYSGSEYVAPARQKIVQCYDRIAEHEFLVGRYYMRKKAIGAALQRFERILKEYPDYTGRDKLFFYMARAYEKVGEVDRARDFFERILRDFPDGEYAKQARQALKETEAGATLAGPRVVPLGVDS
jgi:outer membrane protein assembly factor BamD